MRAIGFARGIAPGLGIALALAATAMFLSEHYAAPAMLFGLLLGTAFGFLADDPRLASGLELAAKTVLRTGVALLGLRISWSQVEALGWAPVVAIVMIVAITIAVSIGLAKVFGFNPLFGFLSGGATAICGASAAMALAAALPAHEKRDQATLFTVIGVSVMSTIAMIVYPSIAHALGLSHRAAGVFIGGTIHDVAQVVGAGYAISPETGDTATIVKLVRVAMLLPMVLIAGQITHVGAKSELRRPPLLPGFVIVFAGLVLVNSVLTLPSPLDAGASALSRWCLLTAIVAVGMKTRLAQMIRLGWRPVLLMLIETALIAGLVLLAITRGWM